MSSTLHKLPAVKANRAEPTYDLRITEETAIALFDALGRIAGSYEGPRGQLSNLREAMRSAGVPDINQPVTVPSGERIYYTERHTKTLYGKAGA